MGLKDTLEANKVPLPSDFDERFNLVMMGLRKDPKFDEELRKFKEQTGGLKLYKMKDRFKSGINSVRDNIQSRVSSVTDKIPATPDTLVHMRLRWNQIVKIGWVREFVGS